MMKLKLMIAALCIAKAAYGQIKFPQASGAAEVEQTIGYTKIEIDYARPNLNNRKAFGGDLVPYNQMWRLGANNNTTIEISTDITIDDKKIRKGTYAIFATPTAKSWEITFNTDTDNWGEHKTNDDSKTQHQQIGTTQKK